MSKKINKLQVKAKRSKQSRRYFWLGLLFSSPWLIGFIGFQLFPILSAVYYSFTEYNLFKPEEFIGLENYTNLFQDQYFPVSIGNTAFMAFIGLPIGLLFALLLALLLSREIKSMPFFRTLYYLPTVVPIVASASLFLWILNPEYGLLNMFLELFGIRGPSWLSDPTYTKPALIIMDTWRCGASMIVFLSALKAVPKEFYEAASLDGAGPIRRFFNITLPYIGPTIQFLFIMGLIQSFQYFTQAYVFASVSNVGQTIAGGPSNSLLFYSLYLYMQGFTYLNMGYASAMAIVLFLIVLVVSLGAMYFIEKRINYDVE